MLFCLDRIVHLLVFNFLLRPSVVCRKLVAVPFRSVQMY
jgi:hypothetical protein